MPTVMGVIPALVATVENPLDVFRYLYISLDHLIV